MFSNRAFLQRISFSPESFRAEMIIRPAEQGNRSGYAFKGKPDGLIKSRLIQVLENSSAPIWSQAKFAEPEWQAAMDEYIDHLGTLKQAVQQNQYEIVQHEIRDLKNRMAQCHQDFKWSIATDPHRHTQTASFPRAKFSEKNLYALWA